MNVGILYIHGIHAKKPGYSKRLHDRVLRYLGAKGATGTPAVREVYWADLFKPMGDHLDRVSAKTDVRWKWLRDEMLTTVAQAVGYEDDQDLGLHEDVHDRIRACLGSLQVEIGPLAPVIIVAHSLGTIIASDYIWNTQNPKGPLRMGPHPEVVMERLPNLRGLVTFGSPLALWAMRWHQFGQPINIADAPRMGQWTNFVAACDPIGWPLKDLNASYHMEVTEDIVLPITWNWKTWTPLAHGSYWTSNRVAATIGDMVMAAWKEFQ